MDTALKEYPELVKQYWAKIIPANDNKFSALNSLGLVAAARSSTCRRA